VIKNTLVDKPTAVPMKANAAASAQELARMVDSFNKDVGHNKMGEGMRGVMKVYEAEVTIFLISRGWGDEIVGYFNLSRFQGSHHFDFREFDDETVPGPQPRNPTTLIFFLRRWSLNAGEESSEGGAQRSPVAGCAYSGTKLS